MKKIAYAAVALALGGCVTGSGTVYHIDDPYQFFAYSAAHGGIPVVIVGNPYPDRRPQVEAASVAALERNFPSLRGFRPVAAAPGEGTKVVLMFDPPNAPHASIVCRDPSSVSSGPGASAARMTIGAVYCGVGPYSEAWLSFDRPAAPDSPQFTKMMNQIVSDAVPRRRDPKRDSDSMVPPV